MKAAQEGKVPSWISNSYWNETPESRQAAEEAARAEEEKEQQEQRKQTLSRQETLRSVAVFLNKESKKDSISDEDIQNAINQLQQLLKK